MAALRPQVDEAEQSEEGRRARDHARSRAWRPVPAGLSCRAAHPTATGSASVSSISRGACPCVLAEPALRKWGSTRRSCGKSQSPRATMESVTATSLHFGNVMRARPRFHAGRRHVQPVGDEAEHHHHRAGVQRARTRSGPSAGTAAPWARPPGRSRARTARSRCGSAAAARKTCRCARSRKRIQRYTLIDHRQHPPHARQQRQLQRAAEGAAAVPRFEDRHGQPHGNRRDIKQQRQQRGVPQRIQLLRHDQDRATRASSGAAWRAARPESSAARRCCESTPSGLCQPNFSNTTGRNSRNSTVVYSVTHQATSNITECGFHITSGCQRRSGRPRSYSSPTTTRQ